MPRPTERESDKRDYQNCKAREELSEPLRILLRLANDCRCSPRTGQRLQRKGKVRCALKAVVRLLFETPFDDASQGRRRLRHDQRRQRFRLLLEASQPIRVRNEVFRQQLDRHIAVESRVARAKHFAHSARANGRSDFVGTEATAFREIALFGVGAHARIWVTNSCQGNACTPGATAREATPARAGRCTSTCSTRPRAPGRLLQAAASRCMGQ